MYHPSRGGVRGGRDQFKWDDVKVDKHRENYLGHSIMAPVGRWQKGKDLHWYTRDKKGQSSDDALKEEIKRIKEQEEQAMREALGLAPKRASRRQGNRLDKHEYAELVKHESTAEDLGAGDAEAAQVQGLGLYKGHCRWAESAPIPDDHLTEAPSDAERDEAPHIAPVSEGPLEKTSAKEDRESRRKRRREEKEKRREKHSKESAGKSRHGGKGRSRHDSD